MKLRYEKRGEAYIPQYQLEGEGEWKDFKKDQLGGKTSYISKIAQSLTNSSLAGVRMWSDPEYWFPDGTIMFRGEIWVCAFLGAAKVWFATTTKDFEL